MTKNAHLKTAPNIADIDDVYEQLLLAHKGLDDAESQAMNARLILILANHIGNKTVLNEAIELAEMAGQGASDS